MIVYLDLYFLINFWMNFMVLFLIKEIFRRKCKLVRIVLGAGVVSLCAIVNLVWTLEQNIISTIGGTVFVCVLVSRITYGKMNFKKMIAVAGVYWIVSFCLSGFLFYAMNAIGMNYSLLGILVMSIVCFGVLVFICIRKYDEVRQRNYYCKVCLIHNEIELSGVAFIDSGNHLNEPYSGKPVSVASEGFIKAFLDEEENIFRLIPFHMADGSKGFFKSICIQKMILEQKEYKNVWIAIGDGEVSTNKEYDLLLHSTYM